MRPRNTTISPSVVSKSLVFAQSFANIEVMERKIYDFPVPEGFDPILKPTKAEDRIPAEKIKIEYVQPEDLAIYVSVAWYHYETSKRSENNTLLTADAV